MEWLETPGTKSFALKALVEVRAHNSLTEDLHGPHPKSRVGPQELMRLETMSSLVVPEGRGSGKTSASFKQM